MKLIKKVLLGVGIIFGLFVVILLFALAYLGYQVLKIPENYSYLDYHKNNDIIRVPERIELCNYKNYYCGVVCSDDVLNMTLISEKFSDEELANKSIDLSNYTKFVTFIPEDFGATIGSMNQTETIFICHKPFIQNRIINGFNCRIKCLEASFVGYADELNITPKEGNVIQTFGERRFIYPIS